jgi:hypothetical protein
MSLVLVLKSEVSNLNTREATTILDAVYLMNLQLYLAEQDDDEME